MNHDHDGRDDEAEDSPASPKFARQQTNPQRPASSEDIEIDGLDRRRGPGRRLSESLKAAEDGQLTREQFLFVMAINSFKQANKVHYPAWTDVLEVIRLLGYRKTQESELTLRSAVDWTEDAASPTGVRPERWIAWGKLDRPGKSGDGERKAA